MNNNNNDNNDNDDYDDYEVDEVRTLMLTEGPSAEKFCRVGIKVLGQHYQVLPLQGSFTNVLGLTEKKLAELKVSTHGHPYSIISTIGLSFDTDYETEEELATLNFQKVLLMMDGDEDGVYMTGLLISFFYHFWPKLVQKGFLNIFLSPLKLSLGEIGSGRAEPIFEEMKDGGLHRISVEVDAEAYQSLQKGFSTKAGNVKKRKEWLLDWMERRAFGAAFTPRLSADSGTVTISAFVDNELVHHFYADISRCLPSMRDGLTSNGRMTVFALQGSEKTVIHNVPTLAGLVAGKCNYTHRVALLENSISLLAKEQLGKHNFPLLVSGSQSGVENDYNNVVMSSFVDVLFPPCPDGWLQYQTREGKMCEPEHFVSPVCSLLLRGSCGVCTGFHNAIPQFNPRDLIKSTRQMLENEEPAKLVPWYKAFNGEIKRMGTKTFKAKVAEGGNDDDAKKVFPPKGTFIANVCAIDSRGVVQEFPSVDSLHRSWFEDMLTFRRQRHDNNMEVAKGEWLNELANFSNKLDYFELQGEQQVQLQCEQQSLPSLRLSSLQFSLQSEPTESQIEAPEQGDITLHQRPLSPDFEVQRRRQSFSPSILEPPAKILCVAAEEEPLPESGFDDAWPDQPLLHEEAVVQVDENEEVDEEEEEEALHEPAGKCDCGIVFKSKHLQQEHWWRDHEHVAPFACSFPLLQDDSVPHTSWCKHLFYTKNAAENHARRQHPGVGKEKAGLVPVDLRQLDFWPEEMARQKHWLENPDEKERDLKEQKDRHNELLSRMSLLGKKAKKRDRRIR